MGFRKNEINPRDIAIKWERQLSDGKLKSFRRAVDLYRKGDVALDGDDTEDGFENLIEELEENDE